MARQQPFPAVFGFLVYMVRIINQLPYNQEAMASPRIQSHIQSLPLQNSRAARPFYIRFPFLEASFFPLAKAELIFALPQMSARAWGQLSQIQRLAG